MRNEYNPDGKDIRFIDEYHTQVGYTVFHICQFAEIMERNGATYMAEPEIMGDEAAWKVGRDRILAVQTCEDGYDYTLLDENYNEIDGGQLDNPDLSMIEAKKEILESFGLEHRELRAMVYEHRSWKSWHRRQKKLPLPCPRISTRNRNDKEVVYEN